MSFLKKISNSSQQEATLETLNESNKPKQRKIIRRQPGDSPHSNDSRKRIERSNKEIIPSSYIKLQRQSEPVECLTERQVFSGKLTASTTFTPICEQNSGKVSDILNVKVMDPIHRKLQHLQQELQIRNKELQLMSEDRQSIKREYQQLQSKCVYLEQINRTQNVEIQKYKQQIRKLTIDKRKLESERASLNKKIQFLERFNFSTDTKNLQSLRESHLEKEVETLKEKVKGARNGTCPLLQEQLQAQREELFTARKVIESLKISNACLQRKLQQSSCFIHHQQDYTTLRSKYKKFLIQYKELRKSFQALQKQNQALRSKQLVNSYSDSFSLELSALNN